MCGRPGQCALQHHEAATVRRQFLERPGQPSREAGREVIWDDRDESPGVKFTDAELLGMPLIVTISPRSLAAGGAEVTVRSTQAQADFTAVSVMPEGLLEAMQPEEVSDLFAHLTSLTTKP